MDTRGVVYQLLASDIVFLTGSSIILYWSKFWNKEKRKKGYTIFGVIACLIVIWHVPRVIHSVYSPTVLCHEGYFLEEHATTHNGPLPFTTEYTFSNDSGKKPVFYLDSFSRKEIFPDDFEEGKRYRIYYDDYTNIILKVEKLGE